MAKGRTIRVLIADRQPIFRAGLQQHLSGEPGVLVVGEADDLDQTLKIAEEQLPGIVILDSQLVMNGRDILQDLQQNDHKVKVIVLTPSENTEDPDEVFRTRTAGILPKQASLDALLKCIRKIDAGEVWVDDRPAVSSPRRVSQIVPSVNLARDHYPLSLRERQVAGLVSQGFRNKEIAQRMFISEQTVKNHLHNIFDKLGVSDRLELALFAIHKNLQMLE